MKIDSFDNTLICEHEDLQTVLAYFKNDRILPNYIEKLVLKLIVEQVYSKEIIFDSLEEYLAYLPNEFIQKTIADINSMFSKHAKVAYAHSHLSYLLYYLPANVFKVWKPLLDLLLRSTLKPSMRILDIGTGPGSVPIGIIQFYSSLATSFPEIPFSLTFVLIEGEQHFLNIAAKVIKMAANYAMPNLTITIESEICEKVYPDNNYSYLGIFDLITMSNFLTSNEGENQTNAVSLIRNFRGNIDEDGSLIIIEPGDERSCKALKRIRNEVANNKILNIFSPCIGIWAEKTSYDCACFNMVRCFWRIPRIYKYLIDKGLNKARRVDVPYNYVVFRIDRIKKYSVVRNSQHFIKLIDLKENIGKIVNVIALIRTVIAIDGRISFSLCDGSCSFSHDRKAVWVDISNDQLKKNGICIPLIAAEKITLKKVIVKSSGERINLEINNNSRIAIDY